MRLGVRKREDAKQRLTFQPDQGRQPAIGQILFESKSVECDQFRLHSGKVYHSAPFVKDVSMPASRFCIT